MLIFWVTDNFLMRHTRKNKKRPQGGNSSDPSILQRVKVKYRSIRKDSREKVIESESEALISGDDEPLDSPTTTTTSIEAADQKVSQRQSVIGIA